MALAISERLMLREWNFIAAAIVSLVRPALAGPPYVSDDPEPTDYKHFEIYTFNNGTATRSDIGGAAGIQVFWMSVHISPGLDLLFVLQDFACLRFDTDFLRDGATLNIERIA